MILFGLGINLKGDKYSDSQLDTVPLSHIGHESNDKDSKNKDSIHQEILMTT